MIQTTIIEFAQKRHVQIIGQMQGSKIKTE